ncbi:3-methyl-2-oxobutanoate hydroxymethyltransferase [Bacteroidales bacterium OttesenSCG-928-B11]|nr:3-methyl-2-oxobutanoate hydroxymethyltransferase [Bacteroidales bacterium OttesenSCG-928-C03]MDL2312101.1 3-methyl-2-oxobutanoate hydroxymethyltransferase [Bacteroidales bacterium OttesenSCG-928-B11]MDL2326074.1 3-methyl-2-oxobutanoate hydroxymethyltransferase [Bacteroidales bacterium OttesenSCG-928-A14]
MSTYSEDKRKVTTHRLWEMKERGEKITMLTAYDYSMAKIIDQAGIDAILVGDSASNTMVGNATTLPMTIDQMIYHAKSVVNATTRALVMVDMPFGTCSGNPIKSLESAIRIMQETGADALKIEGGKEIKEDVKKIIDAGIPVMSHLGLMPQSINKYGTYTVRAKEEKEAQKLIDDCLLMEELGCFAITLEKIPATLATEITQKVKIPIIGIGAGGGVDGQVLVIHDMMGINKDFSPKFLRRYADLFSIMTEATQHYIKDVKEKNFPNSSESY